MQSTIDLIVERVLAGEDVTTVFDELSERRMLGAGSAGMNRLFIPGPIGHTSAATLQKALTGKISPAKLTAAATKAASLLDNPRLSDASKSRLGGLVALHMSLSKGASSHKDHSKGTLVKASNMAKTLVKKPSAFGLDEPTLRR